MTDKDDFFDDDELGDYVGGIFEVSHDVIKVCVMYFYVFPFSTEALLCMLILS